MAIQRPSWQSTDSGEHPPDLTLIVERTHEWANGTHEEPAAELTVWHDSPIGLLFGDPGVLIVTVIRRTGDMTTYRRLEPTAERDVALSRLDVTGEA